LRAGYINDRSPQNPEYTDYMLPSSDRQLVSAGLGLAFGDLALDFSAMRLWAADRSFNNAVAGTGPTEITNAGAWIGGFNVSYKF
ncbi:MAG: transporter, partial [Proteobacteria bacterium]|nr:transporter [Pseudomonadota bacterium]MBU1611137.1 transporter [Pseudomonadota bacterium]